VALLHNCLLSQHIAEPSPKALASQIVEGQRVESVFLTADGLHSRLESRQSCLLSQQVVDPSPNSLLPSHVVEAQRVESVFLAAVASHSRSESRHSARALQQVVVLSPNSLGWQTEDAQSVALSMFLMALDPHV
jgi:hypothetical protein